MQPADDELPYGMQGSPFLPEGTPAADGTMGARPGYGHVPVQQTDWGSTLVAPAGQQYVIPEVKPLTPPPKDVQMARVASPWKTYRRILGTVFLAWLLAEIVFTVPLGFALGEPSLSICGAIFAAPLILWLGFLRRPRVIHLQRAVPNAHGAQIHPLAGGGSLQTPTTTRFEHHLLRDDSVLDTPPDKTLWLLFAGLIGLLLVMSVLYRTLPDDAALIVLLLFALIAIPAWLFGFSIPVLAWWSHSTRNIGVHTRQRDAEAWLVGGMLAAIPALTINSLFFPMLLWDSLSDFQTMALITVVSAPVGEELCKGMFVWLFRHKIRSPRHGFQVGFTVGLGFAMLENLSYILSSMFGGPVSLTLTALIRGLGSIPGHAFWTGLTGVGMGWLMLHQAQRARAATAGQEIVTPDEPELPEWKLVDPKTGQFIEQAEVESSGSQIDLGLVKKLLHRGGDEPPPQLEHAIERDEHRTGIPLPKHPLIGLGLAMLGHAFWNGSLTFLEWALRGGSDTVVIVVQLCWSLVLVMGILTLGRGLLVSVRSAPDGSS